MEENNNQENEDYTQMKASLEINDMKNSRSSNPDNESTPFLEQKENSSSNYQQSIKLNELVKRTQDTLNSLLFSHKKFPDYNIKDNSIICESNTCQNKNENTSDEKFKFNILQTKNINKEEENKKNNENEIIDDENYKNKISNNKNFYTVEHTNNNNYTINTEIISQKTLENTSSNFNKLKSKSRMKKVNSNEFFFNYKNDEFFDNLNSKKAPTEQKIDDNVLNNKQNQENFENKIRNHNKSIKLNKLYNNSNIDDIAMSKKSKSNSSLMDSVSINKAEEDEKNMLVKIENEKQKLLELEKEKNKLINEEKERRKIISNSIERQNRRELKKLIKQNKYENEQKLKNIFLQQEKNKNEIEQLVNNKIQDEEKLNKLGNKTSLQNNTNNYNNYIDEFKFNEQNTKFSDNTKYNEIYELNDDINLKNKIKFNESTIRYKTNNSNLNDEYLKTLQEKNNEINQKTIEILKKMEISKNSNSCFKYNQPETKNKINNQSNIGFKEISDSSNRNRSTYKRNQYSNIYTEDSNLIPNAPLTPNGLYRNSEKNNVHNYSGSYSQTRKIYKRNNNQDIQIPQNMKSSLNKNNSMAFKYNNNGGFNNYNYSSNYQNYNYFNKYNSNIYNNNNFSSINNNYRTEDTINSNYTKSHILNNTNYEHHNSYRKSYGNFQDNFNNNDYIKINDNKNKTQRNFNNNSNVIFNNISSNATGSKKIFNVMDNNNRMNSAFAPWYTNDNNSNIATCENCNEGKVAYEVDNIYKNNFAQNGNYNTSKYTVLKLCPHCKELYQIKKPDF